MEFDNVLKHWHCTACGGIVVIRCGHRCFDMCVFLTSAIVSCVELLGRHDHQERTVRIQKIQCSISAFSSYCVLSQRGHRAPFVHQSGTCPKLTRPSPPNRRRIPEPPMTSIPRTWASTKGQLKSKSVRPRRLPVPLSRMIRSRDNHSFAP
jgi:hypothetical protein